MHTHWHMVSIEKKVDDYPDDWIGCRYKAAGIEMLGVAGSVGSRFFSVVLSLQDIGPQFVN